MTEIEVAELESNRKNLLLRRISASLRFGLAFLLLFDYFVPDSKLTFLRLETYAYCLRYGSKYDSEFAFFILALFILIYLVGQEAYNSRKNTFVFLTQLVLALYLIYAAGSLVFHHFMPTDLKNEFSSIEAAMICGGAVYFLLCDRVRALINLILGLTTLHAIWAVYLYFHETESVFVSGTVHRAGGLLHDPAAFYLFLIAALPLAFMLFMTSKRRSTQAIYMASGAILLTVLVLTWYRAGIIAFAISIAAQCIPFRKDKIGAFYLRVLLPLSIVLSALVLFARVEGVKNQISSERSINGRYRTLRLGWAEFRKHPILGSGVGTVQIDLSKVTHNSKEDASSAFPLVHSQLLHWMVEMGIFGVILYFTICVQILCSLMARLVNPMRIGVAAALLALMIAGLADAPADVAITQCSGRNLLFFLLLCILTLHPWDDIREIKADSDIGKEEIAAELPISAGNLAEGT